MCVIYRIGRIRERDYRKGPILLLATLLNKGNIRAKRSELTCLFDRSSVDEPTYSYLQNREQIVDPGREIKK